MEERGFRIPNISCAHCVATVKRELEDMEGVISVAVDLPDKRVIVRWTDPLTWDQIRQTLDEIGYPPEE